MTCDLFKVIDTEYRRPIILTRNSCIKCMTICPICVVFLEMRKTEIVLKIVLNETLVTRTTQYFNKIQHLKCCSVFGVTVSSCVFLMKPSTIYVFNFSIVSKGNASRQSKQNWMDIVTPSRKPRLRTNS